MSLYGCLSEAVFGLARPFLNRKYDEGNDQRYGHYSEAVPKNALWIHAVSVGEVQSAYPFIKTVAREAPSLPLLISTITKTGKGMAKQLIGPLAQQIYYPWDAPSVLKRTLSTLRPRAYVTIETEIWPEMLNQLQNRKIPAFLVNARLSASSFIKYDRFHAFWKSVIRKYTLIMARAEADRERFIALGADPAQVCVTGDCKVDALIERKENTDLSLVAPLVSGKGKIILAGSTHEGEDTVVLKAYAQLLKTFPSLRLIIVPRHPERAQAVAGEARALGLGPCVLTSQLTPGWRVQVVDRIGVLFALYGSADAVFIGGSLVPKGGQNVMEPAIWGIPFCQGPSYHDFAEATEGLTQAGLCEIVHDETAMARFFARALTSARKEEYARNSRSFFEQRGGASLRSWRLIHEALAGA